MFGPKLTAFMNLTYRTGTPVCKCSMRNCTWGGILRLAMVTKFTLLQKPSLLYNEKDEFFGLDGINTMWCALKIGCEPDKKPISSSRHSHVVTETQLCSWRTVRPNTTKTVEFGTQKCLLQGHAGRWVAHALKKNSKFPEIFQQSPFTGKMREEHG